MTQERWERPAAGREPAGAALLAWLADEDAPRLCVVTGSEGCGKSTLLAWLVAHGTRPGTPPQRRVHGFAPLREQTATTAAWMLADQLRVAARTAGELAGVLTGDVRRTVIVLPDLHAGERPDDLAELALALLSVEHVRLIVEVRRGTPEAERLAAARSAVMDLDEARWTDQERYTAWAANQVPSAPPPTAAVVDLADPVSVCTADPWAVSVRYEREEDGYGGLRAAWLRAGAALTREREASRRALVLSAALGDDADPRFVQALEGLADGAAWRVVWRRVRGDVRPPWPGPARALAVGRGVLDGRLLVTDHQGVVRVLKSENAVPVGRLPVALPGAGAVAAHSDGTVTVLDAYGSLLTQQGAPDTRATGLSALLDAGPTPSEQLVEAVRLYAKGLPTTALASGEAVLAVADTTGTVHAFTTNGAGPRTAVLHRGPVTALAAASLVMPDGADTAPLLYSGGADGTVRAWAPHGDPLETPVSTRPRPVTALAVGAVRTVPVLAVAWADGLVEHQVMDGETELRSFRPGVRVNALALTSAGQLIVGTDEALVCLQPV